MCPSVYCEQQLGCALSHSSDPDSRVRLHRGVTRESVRGIGVAVIVSTWGAGLDLLCSFARCPTPNLRSPHALPQMQSALWARCTTEAMAGPREAGHLGGIQAWRHHSQPCCSVLAEKLSGIQCALVLLIDNGEAQSLEFCFL